MDFSKSYVEYDNGKTVKLNAYPKIHDAQDKGYLKVYQNTKQFLNQEKLVLNDDFEYVYPKSIPFNKLTNNLYKCDVAMNNLVDINSMFIEFSGIVRYSRGNAANNNVSIVNQLTTKNDYELFQQFNTIQTPADAPILRGPNDDYGVIQARQNRENHMGIAAFYHTIPVKSFKTFIGNNQQQVENWSFSTQLAMNTIHTQSERDIQLFGKNNTMSGVQPLPETLKKLITEMRAQVLYSANDGQPYNYPYKIHAPINLFSQIFKNRNDVLFWPTGTPLSLELETRDLQPLIVDNLTYLAETNPAPGAPNQDQLGVFTSFNYSVATVKLYYNEYVLKPKVKEIINIKLLKEPRLYHYVRPQTYIQQCDGQQTIFKQVIQLNNTIPTEIIIFAYAWNNEAYNAYSYAKQDKVLDVFATPNFAAPTTAYYIAGSQNFFTYVDRPAPATILKSFKVKKVGYNLDIDNYDYQFALLSDSLQQDIQTSNMYDGTGVYIKNNYFTAAQYHRLVITPLANTNINNVGQNVDNRSISLEVEIACNSQDLINKTILPLDVNRNIQFVVPTPAQYEIDITRNVNLYKYPSLVVDSNYTHTNIAQINID